MGAASVCASMLAGCNGGVCARGSAWGDVPQVPAFSSCLLEGLPQAPEDIRVVLGRGEVAGVDSLGVERIGQPGFPCSLWHPPPAGWWRQFSTDPLRGRWTRPSRGGSARAHFCSSRSCLSVQRCHRCPVGGAVDFGGGVDVGGCGGVIGTGGGGGPGRVLVVLCRGGAWGAEAWADVDPRVRAHGLRLRVRLGFAVAAVAGHLRDVG